MSYYTLVPAIRNKSNTDYTINFCEGKWKVLHDGNWLQLRPENTRVRDKNNKTWIETCNGHKVEIKLDDPNLDCKCYSKNFSDNLNKDLNAFAFDKSVQSNVDFVLYGTLVTLYDHNPYVYILYYTKGEKYNLRLYVINKESSGIDNIAIDLVSAAPDNATMYVNEMNKLIINNDNIEYSLEIDYVINADYVQKQPVQVHYFLGRKYSIVDDYLLLDGYQLFQIGESISTSFVEYESDLCIATYYNNNVILYDVNANIRAESISDALKVFLFNRYDSVISVEGYDNYIRIKGVEGE